MAASQTLEIIIRAKNLASKEMEGVRKRTDGLTDSLKGMRTQLLAVTAVGTGLGVASIKLASDLEEARSAAEQTFKSAGSTVTEFAETQADAFNISKASAFEYTAQLGAIFNASGLSAQAAADSSVQFTKLAADLASFRNLRFEDALQKIRAGLVGEAEPLRTVGVLLSEARVQQVAYANGIAQTGAKLTEAQKVAARQIIIMQDLADAQGDVARTAGSVANLTKDAQQQIADLGAELGTILLPIAAKVLRIVSELASLFSDLPAPIKSTVVVLGVLGTALAGLGVLIPPLVAGFTALGAAAGVLALNPLVALVAILGTALLVGTVAGNMRAVSEETTAASSAMQGFEQAAKDAQHAAATQGVFINEQASQLSELNKQFDALIDVERLAAAVAQRDLIKSLDGVKAAHVDLNDLVPKYGLSLKQIAQEEEKRAKAIQDLARFIKVHNLSLTEAERITNEYNLTIAESNELLKELRLQALEAANAEKELSDILLDIKKAEAKGLRAAEQERIAESIKASRDEHEKKAADAEAFENRMQLIRDTGFAGRLKRGKEKADELIAQEKKLTDELIKQEEARLKAAGEALARTEAARLHAGLTLPQVSGATAESRRLLAGFNAGPTSQLDFARRVAAARGLTGAERDAFINQSLGAVERAVVAMRGGEPGDPLTMGPVPDILLGTGANDALAAARASGGTTVVNVFQSVVTQDGVDMVEQAIEEAIRTGRAN